MRKLLLLLFCAFAGQAFSQADFDQRLLAKFPEERIKQLQQDQPSVIQYWTYYLDNSYSIVSEADGKAQPTDEIVKIADLENFNILELDVHMDRKRNLAYKIKGTDKYLVMLSNDAFSKRFNAHRKNQ